MTDENVSFATKASAEPTGRRKRGDPGPGSPRGVPAWALGALGLAVVAALLQLLPTSGVVDNRYLPTFTQVVAALVDLVQTAAFWVALGQTMTTWATGVVLAFVLALVLGVVIGSVPALKAWTASTIDFLRPIPSVALIPLAVLLLGTGMPSTLLLVVYASFWQVLIQVIAGVQDVDPVVHDTARSYRFGTWTVVSKIIWPTALPYVLTGFRLAATVALVLTVTGELIIGTPGLGKLLSMAQLAAQFSTVFALVLVTGMIGVGVNLSARLLQRRLMFWHTSVRQVEVV